MEMTQFEKRFVNRESKGKKNAERVARALETVDKDGIQDVLEIGCGIGTVSATLHEKYGWHVIGSDFDGKQIDLARKHYQERNALRFQPEDATKLSFKDEAFDLVISQNVFHHIGNWRDAVREIARVLRPGGYFLWYDVVTPALLAPVLRPVFRNTGVYTHDEVAAAFTEAGFRTLRSEVVPHGPFRHYDFVLRRAGADKA